MEGVILNHFISESRRKAGSSGWQVNNDVIIAC